MNTTNIPETWRTPLAAELHSDWFEHLQTFLAEERRQHDVFPQEADVYRALELTALSDVRVVILGQDPYHDDGQAHGLSFSVRPGIRIPPSLRNIYRELQSDLQIEPATHGFLESWARQGVLMLNTVLTVRAHQANSHRKKGWEKLTDRIIDCTSQLPAVAYVLWGKPAQKKEALIDSRHLIIKSAHPSPLSARNGFFESAPFSQTNAWLKEKGLEEIDWQLPELLP